MKSLIVAFCALSLIYVATAAPAENSASQLDLIEELNNLINSDQRANLLEVVNTLLGDTDNAESRGLLNVLKTLLEGPQTGNSGSLDVLKNLLTVDNNDDSLLSKLVRAVDQNQATETTATAAPGSAGVLDLVGSLVGNKDAEKDAKDGKGLLNLLTAA